MMKSLPKLLPLCAVAMASASAMGQTLPAPPVSPTPVVNYEYDARGNPTRTIQAPSVPGLNLTTTNSYDKLDRATQTLDAKAGKTQFGYDGQDNLTKVTDPRNLVTQYPRNGLGDATQLISPDTGTANHTYDAAGNLKTRTDSRGVLATYTYDVLNRLTSVVYSQSGQTSLTYSSTFDQTGAGFTYGVGRLTTSTHPNGNTKYQYDAQGRVTQVSQVVNAATGANTAALTQTVGYGYDAAGHVTSLTYPSGRQVRITYTQGEPSAISLATTATATTPTTLISGLQWRAFGSAQAWQWQMTSGTQAYSRVFDTNGRLVRYPLGTVVRDLTYDEADRIKRYTHYTPTGTTQPTQDQSFGYDELGRLTQITFGTSNWSIAYDASGNRTSVTLNGTPNTYTTATTSNRLAATSNPAQSFNYDNAGNTTANTGPSGYTATFNLAGRLTTLTKSDATTTYAYSVQGQRIRKYISAGTGAGAASAILFAYDQEGRLLGEYDSAGKAIREYVWLGSTPIAIFKPDPTNAANPPLVYYIHTDHLDAPRAVFDKANILRWRWISEPFGNTAPEMSPAGMAAFTQPLRFPGQYADTESGLNYNWMRDYDASTGRYVESDPIGLESGINTFAYVNSDPLRLVDPRGESWVLTGIGVATVLYIGAVEFGFIPNYLKIGKSSSDPLDVPGRGLEPTTLANRSAGEAGGSMTPNPNLFPPFLLLDYPAKPGTKGMYRCNCKCFANTEAGGPSSTSAQGSGEAGSLGDAQRDAEKAAKKALGCQAEHCQCACINSKGEKFKTGGR